MKNIYMDNAAAAPTESRVRKEADRGMKICGNPSSFNDSGRKAANELTGARLKVARFLGAHPEEIIFAGSGSEANNLAIFGVAKVNQKLQILNSKPHIITTKIEHPSVLEPIKQLEKNGFEVTYLSADREGFIDPEEFLNALRPETVLVSVMYANNEIGTIEPVNKIGKIIGSFRKKGAMFPLFHVHACQAAGY